MVGYDAIERARMVINDLVALSQSVNHHPSEINCNKHISSGRSGNVNLNRYNDRNES